MTGLQFGEGLWGREPSVGQGRSLVEWDYYGFGADDRQGMPVNSATDSTGFMAWSPDLNS